MSVNSLASYFSGVAAKYLSAVEVDISRSNQHEFNGTNALKTLLGLIRKEIPATFLFLSDTEEESVTEEASITWYDARERHPIRSEYRLYFPSTAVSEEMIEGDLLIVALKRDETAIVVVCRGGSTLKSQVVWLFGLSDPGINFLFNEPDKTALDYVKNTILELLGIEPVVPDEERYLDIVISEFGNQFPTTKVFSAFARETSEDVDPVADSDGALMVWLEHEERLFRAFERYLVAERLNEGFADDIDSFISYSLSVQNRRKARAGQALEHHIERIFVENNIKFSRGRLTENRSRPDFIFPGIDEYNDLSFPEESLSMLGVKTSCKDRWRQVLAEAQRVKRKHLFTIEPGISENQTTQMQSNNLQLLVPEGIFASFTKSQRSWLMSVKDFVNYRIACQ